MGLGGLEQDSTTGRLWDLLTFPDRGLVVTEKKKLLLCFMQGHSINMRPDVHHEATHPQ
jgi:hypothetical protein